MYYIRHLEETVQMLFRNFPVVVVSGARQVGKSTMLESLFPHLKRVIFDPVIDIESARLDPDLFLKNNPNPIILDEIQYAPELVSALKRKIDRERKNGMFLITGSQQWEILKNLQESLAGRAVFLDLFPFTTLEASNQALTENHWLKAILHHQISDYKCSNKKRALKQPSEQIWRGFYPEAQFVESAAIPYFFQGYEKTYIDRDIRIMGDVSNYEQFGQFYRLCAALTAQEINYSQLGREIGLSPDTSKRWLNLLKSTYQWIEIDPFHQNTIKRLSKKKKGYIIDSGLACYGLGIQNPDIITSHPSWGALFETTVVIEIYTLLRNHKTPARLYHYRSNGGAEVDLIIEFQGCYYPIEIKGKSRPTLRDTKGIESFRNTFPKLNIADGIIISAGNEFYGLKENIWVVPFWG